MVHICSETAQEKNVEGCYTKTGQMLEKAAKSCYHWSEEHLDLLWLQTADVGRQDPDRGPAPPVAPRVEEVVVLVEDETHRHVGRSLETAGSTA